MPELTISPAGLRVVKLLVGNPPQTVAELVRTAGVTRTAVTEQLNELTAAGFVERQMQRLPGRGRPRHLYQATQTSLSLLFPGNQGLLVPALCHSIHDIAGEAMFKKILKRVSRMMAEHYAKQLTAKRPHDRLRELIRLLAAEGGLVEAVDAGDGQVVLRKRSCPFISMVDARRSVCHVDQEMLSAVVGRTVRQTACRHDGAACCTFEIVDQ